MDFEKKISPKVSLVIAKVAISIVLDLEAMILVQWSYVLLDVCVMLFKELFR